MSAIGAAASRRFSCPGCASQVTDRDEQCAGCDADLRPLVRIADLADRHFNRGLVLTREGRWLLAAENLAVAVALSPDDAECWTLLGKVRLRLGERDAASAAWELAASLAPLAPEVEQTISALAAPPAAGPHQTGGRVRKRHKKRH